MILKFEKIKENPINLLRRAGYTFQRKEGNPTLASRGETGEMSFVRTFSKSGYPRFHIYCHLEDANLIVNFHLDQKKNTYGNSTRHHGEYDESPIVMEEAERLKNIIK